MQSIQPEELKVRAQIKERFLDAVKRSGSGSRASALVAALRKHTDAPEIKIQSVFLQLLDEGKITVGQDLLVRLAPHALETEEHPYQREHGSSSGPPVRQSHVGTSPARAAGNLSLNLSPGSIDRSLRRPDASTDRKRRDGDRPCDSSSSCPAP